MPSLSNIPEPTTGYRVDDSPTVHQTIEQSVAPPQVPTREVSAEQDEPQQQIDSYSCLLILLVAGGLLRLVLGLFGPLQGIEFEQLQALADQGQLAFSAQPDNAYPLPGLMAAGLVAAGLPGWIMVALGSLLTLAATPAAYVIGRATTGRRAAGILAAALVTVHPAVLTASNTLSGTAIAMSLVTIGLALALHSSKRGISFAFGGGITLALAGLAAPLLWVPAALAGPFVAHLNLHRGGGRALMHALVVFVLALGPVVGYRLATLGTSTDALLAEFSDAPFAGSELHPGDRMLITLTDPSLAELGKALHLPVGDAGKLTSNTIGLGPRHAAAEDPVADVLADAWLLMNGALASLATVSIGVLLVRRRFIETALLATPLLAPAFASVTPGEMLRLPMMALVGVLAAGLLANRPVVHVDEEQAAERAAKKAAKLAEKEENERARQERNAEKQKNKLYAFDKPDPRKKKPKQEEAEQPAGVLTARVAEESSIPARPI